jgi:nicotinate-nucleotide adenylyltransferase
LGSVGILGGTFNPPHVGHLICARAASEQLGLERVLLVPAREPPHKRVIDEPGPDARFALCERAVAGERCLMASRLELDRPPPSYTVDTLEQLHERAPEDELIFIAGSDLARSLPGWRSPQRILELARLAVAERAGTQRGEVLEALAPLGGGADGVVFLEMARVNVSSTDVRRRVAEGMPIEGLVPAAVAHEIEAQGLYRG